MTPLHAALRATTRTAHNRLEAIMGLDRPNLEQPSLERYGRMLQVLHAVRTGWEPALAAFLPELQGPHLDWLESDLQTLGLAPLPPASPPALNSHAAAWGVSYVLEGSALGGRFLLRALAPLGMTAEHGGRYLAGRGKDTAAHWAGFLARLETQAATSTAPILEAATAAFTGLEDAARQHLPPP